jgi:hypothetical protein
VRNFGLGLNNSFSRIGGMLSSFAVQARSQGGWPHAPEAIFAALSVVAASLVFLLPADKKGERVWRLVRGQLPCLQHAIGTQCVYPP